MVPVSLTPVHLHFSEDSMCCTKELKNLEAGKVVEFISNDCSSFDIHRNWNRVPHWPQWGAKTKTFLCYECAASSAIQDCNIRVWTTSTTPASQSHYTASLPLPPELPASIESS